MAKTTSTNLKTHPKSTSNKSFNRKRSRSSNDPAPVLKKKQPNSESHRTSGKSKLKSSSNRTVASRDRGGSRGRSSVGRRGDKRGKAAREAGSEDSADTVSEDERGRGRGRGDAEYEGSGEGEDSEERGWSDEDEDEDEAEGGEREKARYRERGRKEERVVKAKGRSGAEGKEGVLMVDGKPISAEQVKMMMRLMKTAAAAGEGGAGVDTVKKIGEGAVGQGLMETEEEEEGDKVELEMSEEDEEEYEDMARECRQDLEDQFRSINKSNVDLVAGYKADKTLKAVTTCLKRKEAEGLLKEYKAWLTADQAYKPAIKKHWETMINAIDADTKTQVEIIRKIEVLVGQRMDVVAAARKAFATKSEEHKLEIEGYQLELDKSKKKSVKAYQKFTDEEAIRKDIGMKLKDAMFAYADILMAGGKSKGSKGKSQDETDEGSEDE